MKKEFNIISSLIEKKSKDLDVGFAEITSDKGHDSFLLDVPDFLNTIKNFLNTSYNKQNEKRI